MYRTSSAVVHIASLYWPRCGTCLLSCEMCARLAGVPRSLDPISGTERYITPNAEYSSSQRVVELSHSAEKRWTARPQIAQLKKTGIACLMKKGRNVAGISTNNERKRIPLSVIDTPPFHNTYPWRIRWSAVDPYVACLPCSPAEQINNEHRRVKSFPCKSKPVVLPKMSMYRSYRDGGADSNRRPQEGQKHREHRKLPRVLLPPVLPDLG